MPADPPPGDAARPAPPRAAPSTAALPAPLPEPPAAGEESDVWWGGYSGRAALPGVAVGIVLTTAAAAGSYYRWSDYGEQAEQARYQAYLIVALVWAVILLVNGRRLFGLTYRLTTRRLFCGEGFLYPRRPAVELAEVGPVLVEQSAVERWLGVGRLRVVAKSPVVLPGVRHPHQVAGLIARCAERARSGERGA